MHKLTVTLKQHTPLIHFQHDQEGATLRASEVKPKLDRFILSKLSDDEKKKGKKEGWIKEKDGKCWLDYKMRIVAEGKEVKDGKIPMYFGNMGDSIQKKMVQADDDVNMIVFSLVSCVLDQIQNTIADFFIENNFGSRQSKGYGCFEVVKINGKNIKKRPSNYVTFFSLKGNNNVFGQIQLLYNSMRSGINLLDKNNNNVFYFKSLLFLYAKSLGIQWEKKTIKEHFANDKHRDGTIIEGDLTMQKNKFRQLSSKDDYPLFFTSQEKYIIKDLFGLSSSEAWKSYNFRPIEKVHAMVNTDNEIQRFKSPILFKVYKDDTNSYTIYIMIDEAQNDILQNQIMGQQFYVINGNYKGSKSSGQQMSQAREFQCFPISVIPSSIHNRNVSLQNFFRFILFEDGGINLQNHVEVKFQKRTEFIQLNDIYTQIKANYVRQY